MTGRAVVQGVAAAPGVALGPAVVIRGAVLPPMRAIGPGEVDAEVARLREAAAAVAADSDALAARVDAEGAPEEAGIFAAQAEMARDPELIDGAAAAVRGGVDAVTAIGRSAAAAAEMLRSLGDELLGARATDVLDVADRIARRLAGLPPATVTLHAPSVVVADDLAPSVTATLPRDRLLGIVLAGSSPTAHAAILARAYGIPAAVGVEGALDAIGHDGLDDGDGDDGPEVMLDGSTGRVIVAPDAGDRERYEGLRAAAAAGHAADLDEARLPADTRDGVRVTLLANIGGPDESEAAVALGAEGVGLFRTEFLFLERSSPPSEDEQAAAYGAVVEAFAPHPVTIRLLDVGGDKPIPYLDQPREENPFLGVRALRLADERPELFRTQLRACYRAAGAGRVKVMAPMVADADDVDLLLRLADEARAGLRGDGIEFGEVELGVMLEIPAAILVADAYLPRLRFASLGTNDLAQYTLAADRGNPALRRLHDSLHPAVLRLVADAVRAAERAGIELSVCGEMAGDPAAALALVGLGVRVLSMSPASLPGVRRAVRGASVEELAVRARAAMADGNASEARGRFVTTE